MFCRDCGTECDERGLCPVCEQKARERAMRSTQPIVDTPFGKYRGLYGDLTISRYGLTIRRRWSGYTSKVTLLFSDVAEVSFRRATDTEYGFLAVKKKGSFFPVANFGQEALNSQMGLVFKKSRNRGFEKVYRYLTNYLEYADKWINPNHSPREYCPRCDSRNICNQVTRVPVYMVLKNNYFCNTCGFRWYV